MDISAIGENTRCAYAQSHARSPCTQRKAGIAGFLIGMFIDEDEDQPRIIGQYVMSMLKNTVVTSRLEIAMPNDSPGDMRNGVEQPE